MEATTQPLELPRSRDHKYSDSDNANDLIALYGDQIRYVKGWGWVAWDGKRWERDAEGTVIEMAKDTLRKKLWEATNLPDYARSARISHLSRSLNYGSLRDMVAAAESVPGIRGKVTDFDRDPYLFNAQNVTIDLRTGETHEHTPADMITRIAPTVYDPEAQSDVWDGFVVWLSCGDADLQDY